MTIDHTLTYTLDGATVVEVVQADQARAIAGGSSFTGDYAIFGTA